jgi:hypothetical protein
LVFLKDFVADNSIVIFTSLFATGVTFFIIAVVYFIFSIIHCKATFTEPKNDGYNQLTASEVKN